MNYKNSLAKKSNLYMNQLFIHRLTQIMSTVNLFIPSVLAIVNIAFVSTMYHTVVAQNSKIIELLSSSKEQILTEVPKMPVETIASAPEVSILTTALPYAIFVGSIVVCGVLFYFYYTSGGHGTPPELPPFNTKGLEDAIVNKVDEKAREIVSVIVAKTNNNASESFISSGFNFLSSSISRQLVDNNAQLSKSLSTVVDNSNSTAMDLVVERLDSNHAELSAQVKQLTVLVVNFINNSSGNG
jgi:hypothetical protein